MGWIVAETPRISSRLNRFEPTTLPTAKAFSPLREATIEVTSSGSEVPSATTVSPISVCDMPKKAAIATALLTTSCPPMMIQATPKTINSTLLTTGTGGSSDSAVLFFFPRIIRSVR